MSEFLDRLDPEFREMIDVEGPYLFEVLKHDVGAARKALDDLVAEMAKYMPPFEGQKDEYHIPGLEDDADVKVIEYRARDVVYPDCAIIWLHGGGYLMGTADDLSAQSFSSLAPVVSVDYRMAPEHRAPAAARDVCAVIDRIAKNRKPRKIIIGGNSAGGGLAASAALMNRYRGGPELAFQLLIYPMLDDQHDTPSGHMNIPPSTWTRDVSLHAWSLYAEEGGASEYAAAARAQNLHGLPPAYIMCGDLDLFLDEDIAYANRLREAGVPVEVAIYPGAPHGFNGFAPQASVSQRANASIRLALEHALK
ncbi:alpha/beta hydrolase [Parasphingorhabdus halotolerans]|uniref:Alpha/beta hydrolase n=1 Tax=Parasphingorhabdus halotolerans TaxID=2725558 RepID=A0A6H2DIE6_9SPHN|nr:alpha/beta hydrolase [Parasphingorhabdus halotolerans]QJB68160.1 alpha/beta hydrolase [Parasphingorhabdus halotolerans]